MADSGATTESKMPKSRILKDPQYPNRLIIEHDGFSGSVTQWAKKLKISKTTLYGRLRTMTVKKALTKGKLNKAQHNPQTHTGNQGPRKDLPPMKAPNPIDEGKWFIVNEKPAFQYKGSIKTIYQWAQTLGLNYSTLKDRLLNQEKKIQTSVVKTLNHGTVAAYVTHGCRCELCRANNTTRHREIQQRKRLNRTL